MKHLKTEEINPPFPQSVIDAMMRAAQVTAQKLTAIQSEHEERAHGLPTVISVRPYRTTMGHTRLTTRYSERTTET